jgi:hypothetical protein
VRDSLGIDPEGGTEPDNFEHASDMNQKWRIEMLKHAEAHERDLCWRGWPYKNNDDYSLPPAPDCIQDTLVLAPPDGPLNAYGAT